MGAAKANNSKDTYLATAVTSVSYTHLHEDYQQ